MHVRFHAREGKAVRKGYIAPSREELPLQADGSETLVTIEGLREHIMIVAEL